MTLFDVAVCTIFAREFTEGAIIIGEYRTAIQHADIKEKREEGDDDENPTKQELLRAVTVWAAIASAVAVAIVIIVAIPLAVLSKNFDEKTADIIEGVSKVVAAICILQLSLKMPKWLGFYKNKKKGKVSEGFDMTLNSVRFNVGWNIWREIAECGVFLLPSFLQGDNLEAIPISAIVGIVVGLAVGFFVYWANRRLTNKLYLCLFITGLLVFLATGLFVGGCHEFEEVFGETDKVWVIENDFWSHKKLPMAILKPFGYSSSRTVLQICCFWLWLLLSACCHYFMYWRTQKILREMQESGKINNGSDDSLSKAEDITGTSHTPVDEESPATSEKLSDLGADNDRVIMEVEASA